MPAAAQSATRLSGNDVSILFPVPQTSADLQNRINLSDLMGSNAAGPPARVWSSEHFENFITLAEGASAIDGTTRQIRLPESVKKIEAWLVAGIRIDPGAPGISDSISREFGQIPQVRLVVQPVTKDGAGNPKVHDISAHLVFNFIDPATALPAAETGCGGRFFPDKTVLSDIIRDIVVLKDDLAAGKFGGIKVKTDNIPLTVHPGLLGASAKPFRDALKVFLEEHLSTQRLSSMAIIGLDFPEPWIFLAMQVHPVHGTVPIPNPVLAQGARAQMLSFRPEDPAKVMPAPANNNLNPITCRHAAQNPPLATAARRGVSTAELFDGGVSGQKAREITDTIADPAKSHFFNTDCVSCHTETRGAMDFSGVTNFPGVDDNMLPQEAWNVRNFGWFPSFLNGGTRPTITRRTATETLEVVEFINREFLGH